MKEHTKHAVITYFRAHSCVRVFKSQPAFQGPGTDSFSIVRVLGYSTAGLSLRTTHK